MFANLAKPIQTILLTVVLSIGSLANADDFLIYAPSSWRKIETHDSITLFRNVNSPVNERIVLQAFPAQEQDAEMLRKLDRTTLVRNRAPVLRAMGFEDYNVLEIAARKMRSEKIASVTIDSFYRDLQAREVQMVERQFVADGRFYSVTYLVDLPAIEKREQVEKVLDQFKPKLSGRFAQDATAPPFDYAANFAKLLDRISGEILLNPAFAEHVANGGRASTPVPRTPVPLPRSRPPDADLRGPLPSPSPSPSDALAQASEDRASGECADVPEDKRRSPNDPPFEVGIEDSLRKAGNCALGVYDNAKGLLTGAWGFAKASFNYATDSDYRSEVNTTAGVIASEFAKDKVGFTKRVAKAVYETVKKEIGDVVNCYKPDAQVRAVCNVASNLIPTGVLAKIILKAPLLAKEAELVASTARKFFPAGAKLRAGAETLAAGRAGKTVDLVAGEEGGTFRMPSHAATTEGAEGSTVPMGRGDTIPINVRDGDTVPIHVREGETLPINVHADPRGNAEAVHLNDFIDGSMAPEAPAKGRGVFAESQRMNTPLPYLDRPIQPIEKTLEDTSQIVKTQPLGGGINQTFKVTYADGTQAIWKPHNPKMWASNYRAEVLAYEVDQSFGFSLVPPTVVGKVDGKVGSIQLFRDGKVAEAPRLPETAPISRSDLNKQSLFDYLIDNRDRHSGNYLVTDGGRIHSIDNGLSFIGKGFNGRTFLARKSEIDAFLKTKDGHKIVERIERYGTSPQFRQKLTEALGRVDAEAMLERIRFLVKYSHGLTGG